MMTPELHGIIRYLADSGVQFRITDVDTPGVHSPTSYHYQGLALDLGSTPAGDAQKLLAIFAAFGPVESRLAELAYRGAPYNIKQGLRVAPYDKYDHVHVAVPRGTILKPEGYTVSIPDDKKIVAAFPHQGGYVIVIANGDIYCYGCEFLGHPTWTGTEWRP